MQIPREAWDQIKAMAKEHVGMMERAIAGWERVIDCNLATGQNLVVPYRDHKHYQ